jgi:DNA-binding NarL/FixJ family response regulator
MSIQYGVANSGWETSTRGSVAGQAPALTPTQFKVLQCVHSGLLNKQIAFELGMAESTVKAHMTALMRKLKVSNRTQAALVAGMCVQQLRSN